MTEWQPIETAPKDGTELLLWDDGPVIGRWDGTSWKGDKGDVWSPDRWSFLPEGLRQRRLREKFSYPPA